MGEPDSRQRHSYAGAELDPATVAPDPIAQLRAWMDDAAEDGWEAGAFTLATADADGRPDARIVLARAVDDAGIRFFTNYESVKAAQLAANPHAAAVFAWPRRYRQARLRGTVERLTAEESDAYFATRPRGSQLGAWASPQSRTIGGREELDAALAAAEARFEGGDVQRPAHWGGYRLVPFEAELWVGRPNRLHDRVRYTRDGEAWRTERLAP